MHFTHDIRVTLGTAATLVNSAPGHGSGEEDLPDPAAVSAFLTAQGWSRTACTRADVAGLHDLRERLRRVWTAEVPDLAREVNRILRGGHALPQLVEHGQGYGWHIHATDDDAPLVDKVAVEIAMALVDLVRTDETDRLKVCAGEGCDDVLVDLSRNRSRKFCDGTCDTRAHVAAYRARRSAGQAGPSGAAGGADAPGGAQRGKV